MKISNALIIIGFLAYSVIMQIIHQELLGGLTLAVAFLFALNYFGKYEK